MKFIPATARYMVPDCKVSFVGRLLIDHAKPVQYPVNMCVDRKRVVASK